MEAVVRVRVQDLLDRLLQLAGPRQPRRQRARRQSGRLQVRSPGPGLSVVFGLVFNLP